ncbi:IclR family transcriptional regulator [Gordonia sputi]|uniref:IclR family transcriptional regulator n=1 Tax=Gordonia sputi TaxID=36823 RepID=UPI002043CD4F|nr:IclR family transcriptional regulator [Gordonia sputi]MCM3897668.1 IclR family transcriptional regulator [Gordonia sputi]
MIQSVDRALRVLTVLAGDHRMSLGQIAERLELPPSTVHGIVRTLLAHRMVVQERDSGRYRLGPAVLTFGNVYLDSLELRARIAPWAEDLARRSGLAVRTAVMLIDDVVVVHHQPRLDGSRQMPEVGIVIPAHASALGKAIMAFDAKLTDDILDADLRDMTGSTLTDPAALRATLADVRATGLAESVEEAVLGECELAAVLTDRMGGPIGAVGVVATAEQWPLESSVASMLRDVARNTSRELGAATWPPAVQDDRATDKDAWRRRSRTG